MLRDDLVRELREAHMKWIQDPGPKDSLYKAYVDAMFEFMTKRRVRTKQTEPEKPMNVRMAEPSWRQGFSRNQKP